MQIPDFLQLPAAERLRACLQNEVPWTLAERSDVIPKMIATTDYAVMSEQLRLENYSMLMSEQNPVSLCF